MRDPFFKFSLIVWMNHLKIIQESSKNHPKLQRGAMFKTFFWLKKFQTVCSEYFAPDSQVDRWPGRTNLALIHLRIGRSAVATLSVLRLFLARRALVNVHFLNLLDSQIFELISGNFNF